MKNDRLSRRFLRHSPDALKDEELLELLLRFTREDARELSERILEQFSNIAVVLEADVADLSAVEGIDEDSILLLRLVPALHRRYYLARSQTEERLCDSHDFGNYLMPYFYGASDEMVYILLLDGAGKVLGCRRVAEGGANTASVPVRKLVQEALATNATAAVIAHNHPCGIALPSREDVELTLRLRELLENLDIALLDHIVIADDDFVSLRDSGYLRRF